MTRVLIIGSSHIGALKNAETAFAAAHPEITLDFFGMRGPTFLKGTMDSSGVFHPSATKQAERELVLTANGKGEVPTAPYDHVLLIGYRFGFSEVVSMLEYHDVQGRDSAGHGQALDLPLVEDMIDEMINVSLPGILDALAPAKRSLILALAPFPAKSIATRAPKMEMARELVAFWAHPAAALVFEMWQTRLATLINDAGHHILWQPPSTTAGPFATKQRYATSPGHFDGSAMKASDHRHMNADYGRAVLTALAQMITTPHVAPRAAPTLMKERT